MFLVVSDLLLKYDVIKKSHFDFLDSYLFPGWAKGWVTNEEINGNAGFFFKCAFNYLVKHGLLTIFVQTDENKISWYKL